MKLCALGFILIVAALIGFSALASFDEDNWRIALASQQAITEAPARPDPAHLSLSPTEPHFWRNLSELSCDLLGLVGISLIIAGLISHVRRTNAAGLAK